MILSPNQDLASKLDVSPGPEPDSLSEDSDSQVLENPPRAPRVPGPSLLHLLLFALFLPSTGSATPEQGQELGQAVLAERDAKVTFDETALAFLIYPEVILLLLGLISEPALRGAMLGARCVGVSSL